MKGPIFEVMNGHFAHGMNFENGRMPVPENRAFLHEIQMESPTGEPVLVLSLDEDLETGEWIASNQSIEAIQ